MGTESILNRKALRDFHILERYEAGIELKGSEVKSIRAGKANISDAFARIEKEKGVDLKVEADRWNARAVLIGVIEPWVASHTAADVSTALQKAGALSAPYKTFHELSVDKDAVLENPMFTVLDQPGIGRYPVAASPVQFAAVPREKPAPAPLLGQHTDEILSGILGLSGAEIGKLHDEKVVGGPR